jgi:hypothetical protein
MTSVVPETLSSRRAFLRILLVAILSHGLLPFCTIVVSDDWFSLLAYKEASFSAAWQGAIYLSMPLTVLQALPFFLVGDNLLVLRTIDFAVIVGLGLVVFLVLSHLAPARRRDALWVSLFTVAVPGYMVHFMVSFLFYPLGLLLFLTALWLVLLAEETQLPQRRRRLFALAAALVFYSFHFGALLVFFLFFIAVHAIFFWRRSGKGGFEALLEYLVTRYWLLTLPLLFWLMRQVFGLLAPTWESYNQPSLNWPVIQEGLRGFVATYGVMGADVLFGPWFLVPFAGGMLWLVFSGTPAERVKARWLDLGLAVVGVAILLVGILPFVLVGKSPLIAPNVDGLSAFDTASQQILALIDTRMHLFLGIAIGFIALHGLRWLANVCGIDARAVAICLVALLAACIAADVRFYLQLEKRAMVMAGVRAHLRAHPELKQFGIVGVVDRINNISTTWDSWPLFFETVWDDRAHFGVPELWYGRDKNSRLLYEPSTIINHQLYGGAWHRFFQAPTSDTRQATFIISPGERYFTESDAGAVLLHQFYRFFIPARHPGYLKKFARVAVIPKIDAVTAIGARSFGARWPELDLHLSGDLLADVARRADGGYYALRNHEKPTHVLVIAEAPRDSEEIGRMGLANQTGRLLPVIRARRTDGTVAILGLTTASDELVKLVDVTLNVSGARLWRIVQVRQQPVGLPLLAWALPEAFLAPQAFYPDAFRGCWEADSAVYASLLCDATGSSASGRIREKDGQVLFEADAPAAMLRSHLIPIDAELQRYLRVDWSVPPGRAASVLVTDPDGRRLLEIKPPAKPAVLDYIVPLTPHWTSVRVVFLSPTGGTVALPRSVQLVQDAPLLSLCLPVAEIFPPLFETSNVRTSP